MARTEPQSGLPVEFLRAVVAEAGPDSPPTRAAVERVRAMAEGRDRDDLMLALLGGALRDVAPDWMLRAAVDSDLQRENQPYFASSMELAAAALSHPSCTDGLREKVLRRCSVSQLGVLGRAGCAEALAHAVAAELQQRGPHSQPMTPELLEKPGTAQTILRETQLHDAVFDAAIDLLPAFPVPGEREEQDFTVWYDAHMAARKAWETMWERVVAVHTTRHRQLLEWAEGSRAEHIIRRHLLGTVPWDVEPDLLEEIAVDNLAGFGLSVLTTNLCRMLRDGASEQDVRSHFADDLAALAPGRRRRVEEYFDNPLDVHEYGCHAAVSWMEHAADGPWRYILNPSKATRHYGEPHAWRASDELLRALGRRFAAVGAEALRLWEAETDTSYRHSRQLRWVHDTLLHLPHVTDEVEHQVRVVLRHTRPDPRSRYRSSSHAEWEDERKLSELRASIERIIGDPATAARKAALGDPGQVTVRDLSSASEEVLDDYLSRHAGDDDLVEKALLSFASHSYRPKLSFGDVLARHSAPQAALLRITVDLRRRLGGSPTYREAWTRKILALPDCGPELVRALPAWTALTIGGGTRYSGAHQAVTSVVMAALGESDEAWARFAASPASYAGPTAWLRLGDILDASAQGTPWPSPPSAR
ncbi:hypothetical protein ACFXCZ_03910 [Streptomyces sp. NPDC059396]|uniref:hypothetical protein n=1 Tax=Streptomyces sp. NPDC059396 TaxID=3346819 RepID=UPI0036B6FE37